MNDREILCAAAGRTHREFLALPYRLHRDDPQFVPPLRRDQRALFDRAHHPFFGHADAEFFVARRQGRTVGRVEALVNHAHNGAHGDRVGFFGAFECERDPESARLLLDRAAAWLHARGMEVMRGPVTHSTNEECGLLVEGFEDPPFVGMSYNPPYYGALLEGAGLAKVKDLHAWEVTLDGPAPEPLQRLAALVRRRSRVTIRHVDADDYVAESRRVMDVYNAAWEHNWGFVPLTGAEFAYAAEQLRPLVTRYPDGALIAESDGRPVGVCLAILDVNQALIRVRSGRLFPFGFLRLRRALARVAQARVLALGVRPELRGSGLDALLVMEIIEAGRRHGIRRAQLGWTLEDNWAVRATIDGAAGSMGLRRSATYRLYERSLTCERAKADSTVVRPGRIR